MSWTLYMVITIAYNAVLRDIVLGQELIGTKCTNKGDILCDIYRYNKECNSLELAAIFPYLFTSRHDLSGQYWPSAPAYFNRMESSTQNKSILRWTPPNDSSVKDLKGFLLSGTIISGLGSGHRFCYVITLNTSSPLSVQNIFNIIIPTEFEDSHYMLRLYCLPSPDPVHEKIIGGQSSKEILFNTNHDLSSLSAADWLSNVTCTMNKTGVMEVTFTLPPRQFNLNIFDVTLQHKTKKQSKDIIRKQWFLASLNRKSSKLYNTRLKWNVSQFEDENRGRYELGITPVNKYTLSDCLCQNGKGHCVGVCRTSHCTVRNTIHNQDMTELRSSETMTEIIIEEEVDLRVYISIPIVLIFSVTLAVVLFVLNKHGHFTNLFKRRSQSQNDNVQPTECNNRRTIDFKDPSSEPMMATDTFMISPIDSKNSDLLSMTLSDQMVDINETYLRKIRYDNITADYIEAISLGGKSV